MAINAGSNSVLSLITATGARLACVPANLISTYGHTTKYDIIVYHNRDKHRPHVKVTNRIQTNIYEQSSCRPTTNPSHSTECSKHKRYAYVGYII